jgi:hypothetical protein
MAQIMHVIPAFDTMKYSQKLIREGISENHAKAHTEALADVIDSRLATKENLKALENNLKNDIKILRNEFKNDVKLLESRLILKLGSILGSMILTATTALGILIAMLSR